MKLPAVRHCQLGRVGKNVDPRRRPRMPLPGLCAEAGCRLLPAAGTALLIETEVAATKIESRPVYPKP